MSDQDPTIFLVGGVDTPQPTEPGQIRDAIKFGFDQHLIIIKGWVDKVLALAQQSEQYFWSFRSTALRSVMTGDNRSLSLLDDCVNGAQKLCSAAYPMLNEILMNMRSISGITNDYDGGYQNLGAYELMGGGTTYKLRHPTDTVWYDVIGSNDAVLARPTRTFYLPTVREVCRILYLYIDQLREWNDTAYGWEPANAMGIRDIYGTALRDMYSRTRNLINQLGPLFPPVICNFYPALTSPQGVSDNLEFFLPTECRISGRNTRYFELELKSDSYHLSARDILSDWPDWVSSRRDTVLGPVYRARGGILAIEQLTADTVDSTAQSDANVTGSYEIYDVDRNDTDLFTFRLSNESLIHDMLVTESVSDISNTSFILRLIRKAELVSGVNHVQYEADINYIDDPELYKQQFTWELDSTAPVKNQHLSPQLKSFDPTIQLSWNYAEPLLSTTYSLPTGTQHPTTATDLLAKVIAIPSVGPNGRIYVVYATQLHIYIGGSFTVVNGIKISNLCRFDRVTGELDVDWTPNPNSSVRDILFFRRMGTTDETDLSFRGVLVISGDFMKVAQKDHGCIAFFNVGPNGATELGNKIISQISTDAEFGYPFIRSMADPYYHQNSDQCRIIFTGTFTSINNQSVGHVSEILIYWTTDDGGKYVGANNTMRITEKVILNKPGKCIRRAGLNYTAETYVLSGEFTDIGHSNGNHWQLNRAIIFQNKLGIHKMNFANFDAHLIRADGSDASVYTILQSGTNIFFGGNFNRVTQSNQVCNCLAKFDYDNTQTVWHSDWAKDIVGVGSVPGVYALAEDDTYLYVGGSFEAESGVYKNLVRYNKITGVVDSTFNLGLNGSVQTIVPDPDRPGSVFVGGYFSEPFHNLLYWDHVSNTCLPVPGWIEALN
ncbi:MAG: hypothetical protein WC965_12495 [Thiohalomonadaceae bacterium]